LVPSRPWGLETAREVYLEGFGLGWLKPEADDLSLPVSLGCDSEYRGTRDDPASLAGFGVCGVQPDIGPVAVSGRSRNALPRSAISLHSLDMALLEIWRNLRCVSSVELDEARVEALPEGANPLPNQRNGSSPKTVGNGRAPIRPRWAFSFEKACSIGLSIGLRPDG